MTDSSKIPKSKLTPALSTPSHPIDQQLQQAYALHQQGNLNDAEIIYKEVLHAHPLHFETLLLLGSLSAQKKDHWQAVKLLTQALEINPKHPDCFNNLAIAMKELHFYDDALVIIQQAIALNPQNADSYNNQGNILKALKRYDEAILSFDQAITLNPRYGQAYSNRGLTRREQGLLEEALLNYDQALAISPKNADAYFYKGGVLQEREQFDEALDHYKKALELKPDYAEAYCNIGLIKKDLNLLDEAIESYKKALSINPESADAHWNLSLCYLLDGNFLDGWKEYEWRWQLESFKAIKMHFSQPLWLGEESLQGKTIFIYAEQGFGDTIQFCRYVPLIADLGAKVILGVQKPLIPLLENLRGVTQIIEQGDTWPLFDFHCPFMSLPLAFKTELNSIPSSSGYLEASAEKLIEWRMRLGTKTKPRIGLVWSGNPLHKNDRNRSIKLKELISFLPTKYEYICLQNEIRDEDQMTLSDHPEIKQYCELINDFSDTAALCTLMDQIISVDTSVAHLAGALGVKTLLLLPQISDFRWLLEREDSPWYASMNVIRQNQSKKWGSMPFIF